MEKRAPAQPFLPSFNISPRGWVVGSLSVLVGWMGAWRGELASTLWGAGMATAWLASLLVTSLSFLYLRKRIESISQRLNLQRPEGPLWEGRPLRFSLSLPKDSLSGFERIPGVLLGYAYRLSALTGRGLEWEGRVEPHAPTLERVVQPAGRGDFLGQRGTLWVEDFFGFFRAEFPIRGEERLVVFPNPYPAFPLVANPNRGGNVTPEPTPPQVSLEELEIRKYVPGDDIRRIHWKLFAHSGELFLRFGEQDPPPSDTVLLHFDPTLPPSLDSSLRLEAVDLMASIGARVTLDLSREGKRILLFITLPPELRWKGAPGQERRSEGTRAPDTRGKETPPPGGSPLGGPLKVSTQASWFNAPFVEVEPGRPEGGLCALAGLAPIPLAEGADKSRRGRPPREAGSGPTARQPLDGQLMDSRTMDEPPYPCPAVETGGRRVLFLFEGSPGAEAARALAAGSPAGGPDRGGAPGAPRVETYFLPIPAAPSKGGG